MAINAQEFLVSLGAEVDEKGINKVLKALHSTKLTAVAVSTAIIGSIAVLGKMVVSLDQTSQKYEQMSRAQKKSTEEIRAQETALKVMGKTLKEVKADKVLNAQYEALLKVGKGLALPEASGGTLVLRDIISTIEELKVKGTYALQWINHYLLNKLYFPLSRLRSGLRNFSMKLSANFPSWMERIANGLSYVVRLVAAGVEGVADLVGWIAKLPPEIKLVGEAVGVAFGASKLGPVGMTIAAITGLLLLLEDFYTWKNGTGPSQLGDFWQSISDGTLLSPEGVQTFLGRLDEVFGSVTEKVGQFLDIGTDITGKITEGISSFDAEAAGETLAGVVSKIILGIENVINGNDTRFYDFAQSSLTMVTTLLGKVMTTLGTFLGSAEWGQMLEGALTLGGNFISGALDLLLGKEGAEGTEAQRGLVNTLVLMLQSVVDGLGDGLKKISFAGLGEKAGAFITGIFEKIGSFFKKEGEADAPIMQMIGSGIDVIKSAFVGIVDFLSSALSSIEFSEVGGSINNALITVVKWFKYAFNQALAAVLGEGEKDGLAGKILDFIRGALRGIGELIGMISFSEIGTEIGVFVNGIFEKIGAFLENESSGETLIGTVATAAGKIAKGIVDLIGSFFSSIDTDTIKDFADKLWGSIQNGIADLSRRLKGEGEDAIDTEGIGAGIGEAIGSAITIGVSFLMQFVTDALAWIQGEGHDELAEIGAAIVSGIMSGVVSLGDALGALVFGEDKWNELKQTTERQGKVTSGEVASDEYSSDELMRLAEDNPEQFDAIAEQSADWAEWLRATNDKYGYPNPSAANPGGLGLDYLYQQDVLRGGISPLFNSREYNLWNKLLGEKNTALEAQDKTAYESALAGLKAFAEGFKNLGMTGDALEVHVKDAQTKVDTDNSQAQEAIKETEESLDDIDGTTAETTIITNHVDNYTTNGGGSDGGENSHSSHGGKFGLGGRFNSPTFGEIGEDDTEYLIPITKLSRARPLILQMFREMGSRANGILADLGVPLDGGGSLGGPGQPYYRQPVGMYPSAAGGGSVKNNSENTVSAPTNIYVYGGGDPERTGRAAAKANEGNIIRVVRGCFEG